MKLRLGSKLFEQELSLLLEYVENKAIQHSKNVLPTSLHQIAKEQSVLNVRFMPLPMPGCLCVVENGFDIVVQCGVKEESTFSEKFKSGEDRTLPARSRFTIAHELAHTYFYNLSKHPPFMEFPPTSEKDLKKMEAACDAMANRMLLPRNILKEYAKKRCDFLDPNFLRELANEAVVSPQVIVSALRGLPECLPHNGGVATVVQRGSGLRLSSYTFGASLKGRFELVNGQKLSDWIKSPDFIPNGGQKFDINFKRADKENAKSLHSFKARFEKVDDVSSIRANMFVTIMEESESNLGI